MINVGKSEDCPDELWQPMDRNEDGFVTWDEFDDKKGSLLERPADDHKASPWQAPDAPIRALMPLQRKLKSKCWTRRVPIVDEKTGEDTEDLVRACARACARAWIALTPCCEQLLHVVATHVLCPWCCSSTLSTEGRPAVSAYLHRHRHRKVCQHNLSLIHI